MLSAEQQAEILSLHFAKGMKVRTIARKLGINRKSVSKVIGRKSVVLGITSYTRKSILDPYKGRITEILKGDSTVPAQAILQMLRDEGFGGGYTIVLEGVQEIKEQLSISKPKEAFVKIDFVPGQVAQVDWGEFEDVFGDGVKIHCFVMVLCYSRLIYIEFTKTERFEQFIRCHENAFSYFGGRLPEAIWYDNLPTAVSERFGSLIKFNARFMAYAGHHHFIPHACNKARGNEKGRVEDGVKYIRLNFWPGRKFKDFADLVSQAIGWRDGTANLREHAVTKKVPRFLFEAEEKDLLLKMNPDAFETDEVFSKELRPDFHILYETNQYSAPWTLVGLVVTVRIDHDFIKIFYRDRFITKHTRCYLKHQKPFTKPEHKEGLLEMKPGAKSNVAWQVEHLEGYGDHVKNYLRALHHNKRSLKHEVARLLALGTIYGPSELNEAVGEIIKLGLVGVERIELCLKTKTKPSADLKPEPLKLDSQLSRIPARVDLRRYNELLFKTEEPTPEEKNETERTEESES
jgi:transposase